MRINPRNIIVDTTFLDAMYRLDLFDNLVMLFSKVYIPGEVEREFLHEENIDSNNRFNYLLNKYNIHSWLKKCNSYDMNIIKLLQIDTNMHKGECEVIAQIKQLCIDELTEDSSCAVLDDMAARKKAESMSINKIGTLRVLALFHHSYGLIDYFKSTDKLKENNVRLTDKIIHQAFYAVKKEIETGELVFADK